MQYQIVESKGTNTIPYHFLAGVPLEHPGALTESDLLSWNWSSHGDTSMTPGDSIALTDEYSEIVKQISECDYDSGKDSDSVPEKCDFVEVCEEETQVGQSLLHIPTEETLESSTMVLGNEKTSSESDQEEGQEDTDNEQKQFDSEFKEYLSNQELKSNSETKTIKSKKEREGIIDCEDNQDIYIEKDRQLSDLSSVTTNDKVVEIENKISITKDEKETSSVKKEKIDPPVGEAIISGPLNVCLNLESQWKRRYLTIVDDCLYIWTSYK